jgi:hypothetical protein
MSPLQSTFGQTVTKITTTQVHPLGTVRVEGNNVYKYMKAGGTIPVRSACSTSAAGTVVVGAASIKACGVNNTGTALGSGDYFWMQIGGEVANLALDHAEVAVGKPLSYVNASGTLSGGTHVGTFTHIGNSTVAATHATLGVGYLSGLY